MRRSRSWVHRALARRILRRPSYAFDGSPVNKLGALPSRFYKRSLHYLQYHTASYDSSTLSTIYQWQEYVENLERYSPGGYHPVCIDDEFCQGRYKIVHKLGFGTFSTIWLAKDNKQSKYVAVKIAVSATTNLSKETSILEHLNCGRQDLPSAGKHQIPSLLGHFTIDGPNGRHQCLISEPLRCSLALSKFESRTGLFPLEAARAIAAQLILGVNYLHSRGVAHGDLHLGNILFRMPTLDALSIENLYQKYGKPRTAPVKRLDNAPVRREAPCYAVVPVWFGVDCQDVNLEDAVVQLCDFGEAFQPDRETRTVTNVPTLLRPPEANFDNQILSFSADIWTLACTLYEVLGERSLFEGFICNADDVLAENISTIGELPPEWDAAWKQRGDFFTSDGKWREDMQRLHDPRSRPLAERVDCMGRGGDGGFSTEERSDVLDMLSKMLAFKPKERITAEELARVAWMESWGLPALAKVRQS